MLDINLIDGKGTGNKTKVTTEGALNVVVHPHPPRGETIQALPFRQYFTDNGMASGSNMMSVDGSTNAVDFYIEAIPEFDIYVKYISVEIGDGGNPNLNNFGALSALSNGLEWVWFTQELGEYELHEGIKTNKEFVVRVGSDSLGFGDSTTALLADVSGGGSEKSYFPRIDLAETYGLPWGIRLKQATKDKLIFRVRDNLTGLTTFNIASYGIRIVGP